MPYANSYSYEDTLTGTLTINFPIPVREIQITNDSTDHSLQFKLNDSEDYRTLYGLETCTLADIRTDTLFLSTSADVEYRIWGLG